VGREAEEKKRENEKIIRNVNTLCQYVKCQGSVTILILILADVLMTDDVEGAHHCEEGVMGARRAIDIIIIVIIVCPL
jgi:hypothetical protein